MRALELLGSAIPHRNVSEKLNYLRLGIVFLSVLSRANCDEPAKPTPAISLNFNPPVLEVKLAENWLTPLDDIPFIIDISNREETVMVSVDEIYMSGPKRLRYPRTVITDSNYLGSINYKKTWHYEDILPARRSPSDVVSTLFGYSAEAATLKFDITYDLYPTTNTSIWLSRSEHLTKELTFEYRRPWWVFPIGLSLGTLLLIVFLWTSKARQYNWRDFVREWLGGTVTGTIVILLSKVSSEFKLPITIDIHDIYGALVIGLLSWRLGLVVMAFLRPQDGGGASSPVTPSPPTVPHP